MTSHASSSILQAKITPHRFSAAAAVCPSISLYARLCAFARQPYPDAGDSVMSVDLKLDGSPQEALTFLAHQCSAIHHHRSGRSLHLPQGPSAWRLGQTRLGLSVSSLGPGRVRVQVRNLGPEGGRHGE